MPSEAAGVQCIDPTGGFRENELDAEGYNGRCYADLASSRVSGVLSSRCLGATGGLINDSPVLRRWVSQDRPKFCGEREKGWIL
jgi:hypothetical protein